MKHSGGAAIPASGGSGSPAGLAQAELSELRGWPARRLDIRPGPGALEPFHRVARLAAMVLDISVAAVTVAGRRSASGQRWPGDPQLADRASLPEQALLRAVIESGDRVVISDARLDVRLSSSCTFAPESARAWAGFPVRDPHGSVVGALCVAGHIPRNWSAQDVELLGTLAQVVSSEIALQVALLYGAERAELARTLQESLLPPRLPEIPGLSIAARYVAGGTGVEVLGDFYDIFPSVRSSWGMVVGDVCGKGAAAAKSTALARYTLRAEAHRHGRPSVILAALNQALLDWLTEDRRFLSAIYATVRPTPAGAAVQVSVAGHPLALVRRANGSVQTIGKPGTLLGLLPDPELHDSRALLRAGDSLIFFTDGVTEARSRVNRELYGDDRLRDMVAGLRDLSAAHIADAIQRAVRTFSGGVLSDDTVALVLQVPGRRPEV